MKQLSVFLEKRTGELEEITSVLKKAGVSLKAVTLSEGSDFGILRIISDDIVKSAEAVEKAGFSLRIVEVLAVEIEDKTGSFHDIVSLLSSNNIDIEYCYTLNTGKKGAFAFKVKELNKAKKILEENSVTVK